MLDEDALLYIDGAPAGFYLTLPEGQVGQIRHAVQSIKYNSEFRTSGLKTCSRVFGFQPRITIRRDFCTAAELAREAPPAHAALCAGATTVSSYLEKLFPDVAHKQGAIVRERIKDGWVLPSSPYTSGIVNWDNQLRYHFDKGNLPGTWNAMLTFKKDVDGGFLAVPELDVAFAVRDGSLTVFNAQGFMHGVTPWRKLSPRAYRYTVVYYALHGMCNCGTPKEELERIRAVKTQRELKRRRSQ